MPMKTPKSTARKNPARSKGPRTVGPRRKRRFTPFKIEIVGELRELVGTSQGKLSIPAQEMSFPDKKTPGGG